MKKTTLPAKEEPEELFDWRSARKHLTEKIEEYKNMIGKPDVNPVIKLAVLHRLSGLYNQGLRTKELYNQIMQFK